jgi:hypothetical protein
MPKKIVKPKSKATIKNKSKKQINIKININSNNKKKGNKLVKQQTIPSQPNFQNPIVYIQPVAPLQNNNSLIDNQFGIGITKQINSLEGEVNRLKIQKDEAIHELNNNRIEREQLADLVEKRVGELNGTSQFIQPNESISSSNFSRPNPYANPKNSMGSSFISLPTHPMDENNSYNPPVDTPELKIIKSRYLTKKPIDIDNIDNIDNLSEITTPSDIVKPSKLKELANKLKIKNMKDKAIKAKYDDTRYHSNIQQSKRAVEELVKTNSERKAMNAFKSNYIKNILNKDKYQERELSKLKEDITPQHKLPAEAKRGVGRPKKISVSPDMQGKINKYEKKK